MLILMRIATARLEMKYMAVEHDLTLPMMRPIDVFHNSNLDNPSSIISPAPTH
jgi:hypothetical protein